MADDSETTTDNGPVPRRLRKKVVDEALSIAEWCDQRRDETQKKANTQMRIVWLLLIGGLLLLLLLPRLIQFIDWYGREESLPPAVVSRANDTRALMAANEREMQSEVASARERRDGLRAELGDVDTRLEAMENRLRERLRAPFALWERLDARLRETSAVTDLARLASGELLAVGGTSSLVAPSAVRARGLSGAFVLGSTDGHVWRDMTPLAINSRVPAGITPSGFTRARALRSGGALLLGRAWRRLDRSTPRSAGPQGSPDWHLTPLLVRQDGEPNQELLLPREAGGGPVSGDLIGLIEQRDGTWRAVVDTPAGPAFYRASGEDDWVLEARFPGFIADVVDGAGGTIMAVGRDDASRPLIMQSSAGAMWTENLLSGLPIEGSVRAVTQREDGRWLALGGDAEGRLLAFTSQDGSVWNGGPLSGPKPGSQAHPLNAAPGAESAQDGPTRRHERRVTSLVETAAGSLVALVDGDVLWSPDGADWSLMPLSLPLTTLLPMPDGSVLAGGGNRLARSLADARAQEVAARLLAEPAGELLEDLVVPDDVRDTLPQLRAQREQRQRLRNTLDSTESLLRTSETSLARQQNALEQVSAIRQELEEALRYADPVRQATRLATRLAVIGLLIYLVQIVVNRYRYLQRLEGFYKARAHAFRFLAASALETELLHRLTLADITAILSPDAIGFGKGGDVPTAQLASLLQTATKTSRAT